MRQGQQGQSAGDIFWARVSSGEAGHRVKEYAKVGAIDKEFSIVDAPTQCVGRGTSAWTSVDRCT